MRVTVKNFAIAGLLVIGQVDAGYISEVARRQALCKECPLNPSNIVKQIYSMIVNEQSTKNCRWEAMFGLPKDLGGPEKPSYDHLIRVNYNENDNTCSVETNNRIEAMGDKLYCIAGGCGMKEVADTHAVVAWGACVIKDTVDFVPGQAFGARECTDARGEIRFSRFHGSENCEGSSLVTAHVGGQNHQDFSPSEKGGGAFWGGIATFCSAMSTGS